LAGHQHPINIPSKAINTQSTSLQKQSTSIYTPLKSNQNTHQQAPQAAVPGVPHEVGNPESLVAEAWLIILAVCLLHLVGS
jgi:hypothetical protein